MRRAILIFLSLIFLLLICTQAFAQCTWKILAVEQDPQIGAIMVRTQYTVPMKDSASAVEFAQKIGAVTDTENNVIKEGTTRYDEDSGDKKTIKTKIFSDIDQYCQSLIQRIPANDDFIQTEILKRNKNPSSFSQWFYKIKMKKTIEQQEHTKLCQN